jgi:8-oxo-dGTP pyrophosphatase MutT (NUDIX family)
LLIHQSSLKYTKILTLQEKINNSLPGLDAHIAFYPLRFIKHNAEDFLNFRKSAVAVHIYPSNESSNDFSILLIERSEYEGTHSKQIAFPGGKVDPEDESFEHTARRESFEEVEIPFDAGIFIGKLTEVNIPVSKFNVIPYVFFHETLPPLKRNEREVNEILSISISELVDESNRKATSIKVTNELTMPNVPCFIIQEKIIWGATALILNELKTICKEIWDL